MTRHLQQTSCTNLFAVASSVALHVCACGTQLQPVGILHNDNASLCNWRKCRTCVSSPLFTFRCFKSCKQLTFVCCLPIVVYRASQPATVNVKPFRHPVSTATQLVNFHSSSRQQTATHLRNHTGVLTAATSTVKDCLPHPVTFAERCTPLRRHRFQRLS
jgi:hypothetical protein